MLLICSLPAILLLVLALTGIQLSTVWVPVIMILCCLAMFHLMDGGCGHESRERVPEARSEDKPPRVIETPSTENLFLVRHRRHMGEVIIEEGDLLRAPDDTYETLKSRAEHSGVTPALQEGSRGESLLVWLPREDSQSAVKGSGVGLNILLLLLTVLTTTWAGAQHSGVDIFEQPERWTVGLLYAVPLLLILGVHELGHCVAARAHRMCVSWPYFIPIPFGLGTFGAFIQLKSPAENRRALFDVGVAGPLAGLLIAIPALWIGLKFSQVVVTENPAGHLHNGIEAGSSVLLALTAKLALGDVLSESHRLILHPIAFAGWLGLLLTALNLLPIGQLDGGHIADAMFGRIRSAAIGTAALLALVFLGLFMWSGLLTWAFIVYFIAGSKGLPPLNDLSRLGIGRLAIGVFAFVMLFLILAPVPHRLYDALGIHCPYL